MQARTQEQPQEHRATAEQTHTTKRRFDVHEYHRMGEAGVFGDKERVELMGGEVVEVNPVGARHFTCLNRLNRIFVKSVNDEVIISPQNPVRLDDSHEPEPDLAVIKMRDYRESLPAPEDILLLVEVSDTTPGYDRNVKLPLYARFEVPEVWIVDLGSGIIERHTEPSSDGYRLVRRFGKEDNAESAVVEGVSFAAKEVLG